MHMPTDTFAAAVTLSMYTLIPTTYRAFLKSAVSGIGHRIIPLRNKQVAMGKYTGKHVYSIHSIFEPS